MYPHACCCAPNEAEKQWELQHALKSRLKCHGAAASKLKAVSLCVIAGEEKPGHMCNMQDLHRVDHSITELGCIVSTSRSVFPVCVVPDMFLTSVLGSKTD